MADDASKNTALHQCRDKKRKKRPRVSKSSSAATKKAKPADDITPPFTEIAIGDLTCCLTTKKASRTNQRPDQLLNYLFQYEVDTDTRNYVERLSLALYHKNSPKQPLVTLYQSNRKVRNSIHINIRVPHLTTKKTGTLTDYMNNHIINQNRTVFYPANMAFRIIPNTAPGKPLHPSDINIYIRSQNFMNMFFEINPKINKDQTHYLISAFDICDDELMTLKDNSQKVIYGRHFFVCSLSSLLPPARIEDDKIFEKYLSDLFSKPPALRKYYQRLWDTMMHLTTINHNNPLCSVEHMNRPDFKWAPLFHSIELIDMIFNACMAFISIYIRDLCVKNKLSFGDAENLDLTCFRSALVEHNFLTAVESGVIPIQNGYLTLVYQESINQEIAAAQTDGYDHDNPDHYLPPKTLQRSPLRNGYVPDCNPYPYHNFSDNSISVDAMSSSRESDEESCLAEPMHSLGESPPPYRRGYGGKGYGGILQCDHLFIKNTIYDLMRNFARANIQLADLLDEVDNDVDGDFQDITQRLSHVDSEVSNLIGDINRYLNND